MDYKKITIKKSQSSFMGLILGFLLVIGVFTALFLWIHLNATEQGVTIDSKYNTTYTAYQDATESIESNVEDIDSAARNIKEADSTFQVAWNGLKGLGSVLRLPLSAIDSGQTIYDSSITQAEGIIPSWATVLIRIALIALVVLIVIAVMKGDNKLIN